MKIEGHPLALNALHRLSALKFICHQVYLKWAAILKCELELVVGEDDRLLELNCRQELKNAVDFYVERESVREWRYFEILTDPFWSKV